MADKYLQPSGKVFDDDEKAYAHQAVDDGWWTEGRWALDFERKLRLYLNRRFVKLTNSGSSANLLAISALMSPESTRTVEGREHLKPGDHVITTALGFPTTIAPIIQNGLIPIFVDVDRTLNIDVEKLEETLPFNPKAMIIAHTLGNPFAIDHIVEFCEENNIWLIEDNCDALGSMWQGKLTGSFGDISTQSFYPAHHITTGEGGAITTDNPVLAKIITSLRDWGRDCWCSTGHDNTCGKRFDYQMGGLPDGYDHKYIYSHFGYNMKMTDMQAAIGVAQMGKLDEFTKIRIRNNKILSEYLRDIFDNLGSFDYVSTYASSTPSWFGVPIMVTPPLIPANRPHLLRHLHKAGIGSRLLFAGNMLKQPAFEDLEFVVIDDLSNTDIAMKGAFWVGCWPGLTEEDMRHIGKVLFDYAKEG